MLTHHKYPKEHVLSPHVSVVWNNTPEKILQSEIKFLSPLYTANSALKMSRKFARQIEIFVCYKWFQGEFFLQTLLYLQLQLLARHSVSFHISGLTQPVTNTIYTSRTS